METSAKFFGLYGIETALFIYLLLFFTFQIFRRPRDRCPGCRCRSGRQSSAKRAFWSARPYSAPSCRAHPCRSRFCFFIFCDLRYFCFEFVHNYLLPIKLFIPFGEAAEAGAQGGVGFEAEVALQCRSVRKGHRHIARLHRHQLLM